MARAYDHMPRFSRLVYYISQRMHELEGKRDALEAERRMWKETTDLITLGSQEFVRERMGEIEVCLEKIALECREWDAIKTYLPICKTCGGYGETREMIDQDESRLHKCSACRGTGQL